MMTVMMGRGRHRPRGEPETVAALQNLVAAARAERSD